MLENVEVLYNNTDMPVKKPSGSGILGNLFGEDENGEGNGILIWVIIGAVVVVVIAGAVVIVAQSRKKKNS